LGHVGGVELGDRDVFLCQFADEVEQSTEESLSVMRPLVMFRLCGGGYAHQDALHFANSTKPDQRQATKPLTR